jgi:hypothetical protein
VGIFLKFVPRFTTALIFTPNLLGLPDTSSTRVLTCGSLDLLVLLTLLRTSHCSCRNWACSSHLAHLYFVSL